jgi:predicted RNA-binding protein with PUA-like domain
MNYWLMKSEPSTFSIEDLGRAKNRTTAWDGVRNYQARNFLRDQMKKGDLAFFYHSSCEVPGIAGVVKVVREGYPDRTAFKPKDDHYDPDSDPQNPRWYVVDVQLQTKFDDIITLETLRAHSKGSLKDMLLLKRGNRLSITPLTKQEWTFINSLA